MLWKMSSRSINNTLRFSLFSFMLLYSAWQITFSQLSHSNQTVECIKQMQTNQAHFLYSNPLKVIRDSHP